MLVILRNVSLLFVCLFCCLSLLIILFTASPSILSERFVVTVVFIVSSRTQVQFVLH